MNTKSTGRRTRRRETAAVAVLVGGMCWLAGCGGGEATYGSNFSGGDPQPTSGIVKVDGEVAAGAVVTLIPEGGVEDGHPAAGGRTDKQGRFSLTTNKPKDGAPVGKYKVVLSWIKIVDPEAGWDDQPPEAEQIPMKYQSPTTTDLSVEIKKGINELKPFEVSRASGKGRRPRRRMRRIHDDD